MNIHIYFQPITAMNCTTDDEMSVLSQSSLNNVDNESTISASTESLNDQSQISEDDQVANGCTYFIHVIPLQCIYGVSWLALDRVRGTQVETCYITHHKAVAVTSHHRSWILISQLCLFVTICIGISGVIQSYMFDRTRLLCVIIIITPCTATRFYMHDLIKIVI